MFQSERQDFIIHTAGQPSHDKAASIPYEDFDVNAVGTPVGIFRTGCLTGPQHAAVELHGFLAYIVWCAVAGCEYSIYGYKGKQVRDQIHCRDVASLFLEFYCRPRVGEVYNLGGGRANRVSILETIEILEQMGHPLQYRYGAENRSGDHICYISDLIKLRAHFPQWQPQYNLQAILVDIVKHHEAQRQCVGAALEDEPMN